MPKIFPVIATKDRPNWLTKQIAAIRPQLQGDEKIIIVVDGGASMESLASEAGENIEWIHLAANVGVDRARRIGNAMVPSNGIVCEIDDHDIAKPELLEELRTAFRDEKIILAFCDVDHTDPKGRVCRARRKRHTRMVENGNLGWGMRAYRKWAYDCIGGYPLDNYPANDFEMLCRLEEFGGDASVKHIRRVLVTVLEDRNGLSGQHKDEQQQAVARIAQVVFDGGFELPFSLAERAVKPKPTAPRPGEIRRTIPRIVHFVWAGPPMPEWVQSNIDAFKKMNQGYQFLIHGEEVLLPQFKVGYDAIEGGHEWARKSDLLRVSALLKFGGWYFDTDFVPFRPIDDIYDDYENFPTGFFLTQGTPNLVANGIIGTSLNSKFLKLLEWELTALASVGENRAWDAFGPRLYTDLATNNPELVTIGKMENFYPLQDREEAQKWFAQNGYEGFISGAYMLHLSAMDELELIT